MIFGKSYVAEIDVPFDEIDEGGVVSFGILSNF